MNENKSQQLLQLKTQIAGNSINWLFPSENSVQGFMGLGGEKKIMFVGERPSTENHGKHAWKEFFYGVLVKHNLGESHLTDLVKSRAKGGEDLPADVWKDWEIFKQEIDIVEPKLIFALSAKVYDYIFFLSAEKKIRLVKIYHYSYAVRYNKKDNFETQIQSAITEIKN